MVEVGVGQHDRSICRAGTGVSCQLRSRHSFGPWNMPQSTRTWKPLVPLESELVLISAWSR